MSKFMGVLLLFLAGIVLLLGDAIAWLISIIYLLIDEVIFTKKFNTKFKELNVIFIDEFKDTISSLRSIYEEV